MSVISRVKQLAKLRRKPYRDAYVEEHVKTSLPFQIRALREQREWSQKQLGDKMGMRQGAVSRLEKADYGKLSVNTLLRLASAFDVALLIKFAPFRKLLDEFEDLSTEALQVPSFDEEAVSLEEFANAAAIPVRTTWHAVWTQRELKREFTKPDLIFYGGGEVVVLDFKTIKTTDEADESWGEFIAAFDTPMTSKYMPGVNTADAVAVEGVM